MPRFAASISYISTPCQSIPGHALLLFPIRGGLIIGECANPTVAVNECELTAPGSEDDTHGQLQKFWMNMVSKFVDLGGKR